MVLNLAASAKTRLVNSHSISSQPATTSRRAWIAPVLIATLGVIAYSSSFRAGFVFDDYQDILSNPSIRRLWPPRELLLVEQQGVWRTITRPVVNFTFAIDYALAGLDPRLYHLTNVAIHVLAGCALFGVARQTVLSPRLGDAHGQAATPLALVIALVWTLHPLNTQAVCYVTQRYESLMGLFFLLAIYAANRSDSSRSHARLWNAASVLAALLALGCKEVAVALPIVILLYDRAFLAGSFAAAWSRRRGLYLGLLGDWAMFFAWQRCGVSRASFAGDHLSYGSFDYATSQPGVILHYLRLAFWPQPLVLDYAWPVARGWADIALPALAIGLLFGATLYALARRPSWGWLGATFFLILAPTSSVLPLADLAVEHRMYLPLTIVITAVVLLICQAWLNIPGAADVGWSPPSTATLRVAIALVGLVSIALTTATWLRARVYCAEETLWADTVAKAPGNERARNNLGLALANQGQFAAAALQYRQALELAPNYADAHNNLGMALAGQNEFTAAASEFREALRLKPGHGAAHNNLGLLFAQAGDVPAAAHEFELAAKFDPHDPNAHANLGAALLAIGLGDQAMGELRKAIELKPDFARAENDLGRALIISGQAAEAAAHFQRAVEIDPNNYMTRFNLSEALGKLGRTTEAQLHFRRAAELAATMDVATLRGMATAQASLGRAAEALRLVEQALSLAQRAGNPEAIRALQADRAAYRAAIP